MKEYLDKIVTNGKKEDMDCLGEMMVDMLYDLKERDHNEYKKYKNKIVGMAYDYKVNDELAEDIVHDMKPKGEYWDLETVKSVIGDIPNLPEVYVVMNSLVNDYGEVISPEDVDTYVKMTNAWINDVDGHKDKVWWYFVK